MPSSCCRETRATTTPTGATPTTAGTRASCCPRAATTGSRRSARSRWCWCASAGAWVRRTPTPGCTSGPSRCPRTRRRTSAGASCTARASSSSRRTGMRVMETQGRAFDGIIVSADSHVMEPVDLWKKGVPEQFRDAAPLFPPHKVGEGFQQRAGGWDPNARIKEMEVDGLSAEVLYPTLLLSLYALDDARLQEACFRA